MNSLVSMERHKCDICSKRFLNGRALIDHIRSHLLKTEDHEYEEEEDEAVELGSDSETDSSRNPIPRRSKRIRRIPESMEHFFDEQKQNQNQNHQNQKRMKIVLPEMEPESEPVSSISCTSPDEDVAYCLMSMKNDTWVVKDEIFEEGDDDDEETEDEEEEEEEEEEDYAENKKIEKKNRGRYKCETCNKVFRSYQALGGHRASHKKTTRINPTFDGQENDDLKTTTMAAAAAAAVAVVEEKIHECPVCYRVFASGQALGGHKRSHVIGATVVTGSIHRRPLPPLPTRRTCETMIDLNLPAPMDEDEIIR